MSAFLSIEEDSSELAKPKMSFPETAEEELGKHCWVSLCRALGALKLKVFEEFW